MLKDFFYEIYSYDGFNWFYLVLLTSFILFPVVLFFVTKWIRDYRKNHKKCTIFKIIILLLVSFPVFWELIPSGFNTLGWFNIKYYDIAINTSFSKTQKGLICLNKASLLHYLKDGAGALKTYDEAYEYLGDYKAPGWFFAFITYEQFGEIDKALKIAEARQDYNLLSGVYIIKGDYKKALEYINKDLDKKGSCGGYARRSYINRMLGNKKAAKHDYNKALKFCNNNIQYLNACQGNYREDKLLKIKKNRLEYGLD